MTFVTLYVQVHKKSRECGAQWMPLNLSQSGGVILLDN